MATRPPLVIGIDPGVQTGYAVWSRNSRRFVVLTTTSFWEAYDEILAYGTDDAEIFIEQAPRTRMYQRNDKVQGQRVRERMSANIGSNQREASLLIERLKALGYTVTPVSPVKQRKWDAAQFRAYTRHEGRSSQHSRDAGRLVFQR